MTINHYTHDLYGGAGIGYASCKQGATNTAACPIRVSSEVPDMSEYRINRFIWHVRALTGPTATAHKPVVGVRRLHHIPNAGGEEPGFALVNSGRARAKRVGW